jgi:hypothetical protein
MELKRTQVFDLNAVLNNIEFGENLSSRFRLMFVANARLTQVDVDEFNAQFGDSEGVVAFRSARAEIMKSYEVITEEDAIKLEPDVLAKMNAEIQLLMDSNKTTLDEADAQSIERNELMVDSTEIALKTVDVKYVPEIPDVPKVSHWVVWNALLPVITSDAPKVSVEITRRKLIDLHSVLTSANFELPINNSFRYSATKNVELIAAEMNDIDSKYVVSDEYIAYQADRKKLLVEFDADTDEKVSDLDEEAIESLKSTLAEFDDKYVDVIAEATELDAARNTYVDEVIQFDLHVVDGPDDIPVLAKANKLNEWFMFDQLGQMIVEK